MSARCALVAVAVAAAVVETASAQRGPERADTAALRMHVHALAAMNRLAGRPGSVAAADRLLATLAQYGLDTARQSFTAFVPYADSVVVERLEPRAMADLPLRLLADEPLPSADSVAPRDAAPPALPFSGRGDARGPLVYVNQGRDVDLALLDSLGHSLRGAVALARLGGAAPGLVARRVARRGAVALLLFGDPADDGFMRGDPAPGGAMRHPDALTRVAVATPNGSLAPIPVAMLGFRNVVPVFSFLERGEVPDAWQGGLPFRYHSGPDAVQMRVGVWGTDSGRRTLANVLATLPGSTEPGEVVVVGAHRDAWGAGAADNAGGVAVLLEAARILAAEARDGGRLRRTILFAAWDGGLWRQAGARAWLDAKGASPPVAYVDLDEVVTGATLSVRATPEVLGVATEVLGSLGLPTRTPASAGPRWHEADDEAFRQGAGVPTLRFSWDGPQGRTGSSFDTPSWLERIADPGYTRHARTVEFVVAALRRLAGDGQATVDPAALARATRTALDSLRDGAGTIGAGRAWKELERAIDDYERASRRVPSGRATRASALAGSLAAFVSPSGHVLDGRDPRDERTLVTLPQLRAALALGRREATEAAITDLTSRFALAAQRLQAAVTER